MTPLSVGTQTKGSIIRPASYCGVVGYKPSFGLISRNGILKQSSKLDHVGVFGKNVEALNNKEVKITGYMLTLAPDEGVYVLSQNPYADCFFCGYGGPETAIELVLKPGHDDFLMDELVTVTGTLKLIYDDITSGVYRMINATAVKE